MERLRQGVFYGLHNKLGDTASRIPFTIASPLPGGRMFAPPAAFLRPNFSAGRGTYIYSFMVFHSKLVVICKSYIYFVNFLNIKSFL